MRSFAVPSMVTLAVWPWAGCAPNLQDTQCRPGQIETCYSGPTNTAGIGICQPGTRTCSNDGIFGPCNGETLPAPELCDPPGVLPVDEDCDGRTDDDSNIICPYVALAAGSQQSYALRRDGTIWAWGNNDSGQLGTGDTLPKTTPVQVHGVNSDQFIRRIVAIAAGRAHALALDVDGRVWTWGDNAFGQLGIGSTVVRTQATPLDALSDIKTIAAGHDHSLAADADGVLWAWGSKSLGALGDGTTTGISTEPLEVQGVVNVIAMAAGKGYSLALTKNGDIWAWGGNANGQLGDDTTTNHAKPKLVPVNASFTTLAAGQAHSIALNDDSDVLVWGANAKGQVGDGSTTDRTKPYLLPEPAGVMFIAGGDEFSIALPLVGSVWTWGSNDRGQLGDGSTTNRHLPATVQGLSQIIAVAAKGSHALALHSDGTVRAWGANDQGQLGDGSIVDRALPVRVELP